MGGGIVFDGDEACGCVPLLTLLPSDSAPASLCLVCTRVCMYLATCSKSGGHRRRCHRRRRSVEPKIKRQRPSVWLHRFRSLGRLSLTRLLALGRPSSFFFHIFFLFSASFWFFSLFPLYLFDSFLTFFPIFLFFFPFAFPVLIRPSFHVRRGRLV